MTALERIQQVLKLHLGLATGSVGGRVIEDAVRRRMQATHMTDANRYADAVVDGPELDELVEAVVVPETWFYRYPESFRHLAAWATKRPQLSTRMHPLRVLCAPCATGEEAYSAAITLLDAGLAPGSFHVDGVDISRRAVEQARCGIYGPSALRETSTTIQSRHFDRTGRELSVGAELRRLVRFRVGNLADPQFLAGEPEYEVVFCRNLFIYLTDAARRTAITTLERLLAPGGIIYMGHAEPLGLFDERFKTLPPPAAFAFHRLPTIEDTELHVSLIDGSGMSSPKKKRARPPVEDDTEEIPALANSSAASRPDVSLTRARAAADAGCAAEASRLAETLLRCEGPSAELYTLIGVVHAMTGDLNGAEASFTKALYLDPGHYDALIHMMTLSSNRGDTAAAANFRRRAARRGRTT